jgi:preprotein translocase subunit SecG
MDFLSSHWHCIIPAIAIVIVVLLQGRGKKQEDE